MKRSTSSLGNWARVAASLLLVALATSAVTANANGGTNQIRDIKVHQEGGQTIVTVVGSSKPTFTAFKLTSPRRLVVDVANSRVKGVPSVTSAGTPLVDAVAVSEFTSGGVAVARVMIGFKEEAAYRVTAQGNNLVVSLRGGPAPVSAPAIASADPAEIASAKAEAAAADKGRKEAEAAADAAKAKLAEMQADVNAARREMESAKAKIAEIAARSAADAARASDAAAEADKARAALKSAKAELEHLRASEGKALDQSSQVASKQASALREEIARAEARAAEERAKRESLERYIASLEGQRDAAKRAAERAEQARATAAAAEKSAKDDVFKQLAAASAAKERAASALQAQKEAQTAYERAAVTERSTLLEKLRAREREVVEANRRVVETEAARRNAERAATAAVESSNRAKIEASRTIEEKKKAESKLVAELERANAARGEAERQAQIAEAKAASALAQKELAENEARRARESAAQAAKSAKTEAANAVAAAEERIARADAARIAADKQRVETQEKLSEAEKNLMKSKTSSAAAEAALADAMAKIAVQEKRIAELEDAKKSMEASSADEAAKARETIASQEKKIQELSAAKAARAEAAGDETPGAKKGRMTQEERRLARLEQMKKGSTGATSKQSRMADDAVPPEITDIRFIDEGGEQKIVIESSAAIEFDKAKNSGRRASLVLRGAALPAILERTLDAGEFEGVVKTVSSYEEDGAVRVDVELSKEAHGTVARNGDSIEWTFANQKRAGQQPRNAPLNNETKTVNREDAEMYAYPNERTAAYGVTLGSSPAKKKQYTGRHIDLDFKDADIHNILRLLADVGQVNIVTGDDVSGTVTIRMRDVPWDQALDVVLRAKGYGMVREGNLIRVAPLATLDKERELELQRRRANKEAEPLETRLIPVSYATAAELSQHIDSVLSERGSQQVDERTNVIIVRDTAANLDQVEALIRNLDTQTPQVLIEGRIVEATSTYAREIGIQWGGDFTASSATGNPTGLGFPSTVGVAGGATDGQAPTAGLGTTSTSQPNPNFAVNLPAAAGTGSGGALGITLGSIANNANLNLRLSAMEEEGTLRILSSPKILTLDNRAAFIEQGTLIPYSRVSAQGVQTAFKEAKLNLTVVPHVTAAGSVLIKLSMTRDEPDFNNKGARGDPTILKRAAQTELLVNDGHTAVIGGIFTRNNGTSFKKVPFFGDIPVLGWLFKSKSDSDRRTEMLIFITPRIVNRSESIGN